MLSDVPRAYDLKIQSWDMLRQMPRTRVVDPVRVVPRPVPAFVLDLSGESLRHDLLATGTIPVGGILLCDWRGASVYGWDAFFAFMSRSGAFTTQDADNNAFRVDRHIGNLPQPPYFTPRPSRDGSTVRLDFGGMPAADVVDVPGEVYFGSPIEPLNWGMWLLHAIPCAREFLGLGQRARFGCWFKLDWQRDLLAFMGIGQDRLLQLDEWKLYRAERLRFRAYPAMELFVRADDRAIFTAIAQRCSAASTVLRHDRIFVSRLSRSTAGAVRGLQNEAALAAALGAIGFTVIEPEKLPFIDQVALFASARVVVGLGGAGMFNTVFSRPGTRVVTIEASAAFVHNHANLFKSLGLDYGVIFGARDPADPNWPHHRWTLDVPAAVARIAAFA